MCGALGGNPGVLEPARSGRRGTLSRELQHRNELLQSEFEDLGNFQKRLAVGNALQDLSQRHPSSADSPNVASGNRTGTRS